MKRIQPAAYAAILVLSSLGTSVSLAQPQVPVGPAGRPPVVSPYLGMLGGFGNPALNYFGFVQPQMQMQQQMNQMQFQQQQMMTGRLGGAQQGDPSALLPATGTVPVFDNTFGYFNRLNGAGGNVSTGGGMMGRGAFASPPAPAGAASFNRSSSSSGSMPTSPGMPSFAPSRGPATNGGPKAPSSPTP